MLAISYISMCLGLGILSGVAAGGIYWALFVKPLRDREQIEQIHGKALLYQLAPYTDPYIPDTDLFGNIDPEESKD